MRISCGFARSLSPRDGERERRGGGSPARMLAQEVGEAGGLLRADVLDPPAGRKADQAEVDGAGLARTGEAEGDAGGGVRGVAGDDVQGLQLQPLGVLAVAD